MLAVCGGGGVRRGDKVILSGPVQVGWVGPGGGEGVWEAAGGGRGARGVLAGGFGILFGNPLEDLAAAGPGTEGPVEAEQAEEEQDEAAGHIHVQLHQQLPVHLPACRQAGRGREKAR